MVLSTTRTSGVVVVLVVETVDIKLHHQLYCYHYSFYSLVGAGAVVVVVAVVVVAKVELLLVVVAVEECEFVVAWMACWHVELVVVVGCAVLGTRMALLVLCWRLLGVETAAGADAVVVAGRMLETMHVEWMQQHPSPQPTMHRQPPELHLHLLILLLPKTCRKRLKQPQKKKYPLIHSWCYCLKC